ncbi:L-arabonate dehydratase [Tsuneonella dongtanensis]|uniref:L-arabonate dehydratase n=1 Tax=Tsuneonella dongtanensis TaxID=692370 RepID=A0A1B2AB87_9SPHN|nr:IlvD/Edd family dehydratase [Tsuneonella dongtanensis]ANY19361.1 L-arabonate dehydratase [Tsuneonella dongtanensis]
MSDKPRPLRSAHSYGKLDRDGFIHRSWMKAQGYPADVFDGRPIIGICNTWSEITPCNSHLREIAEYVKRGVWEAGGLPLELPAMSLGETQMRPTAMLFRNLLAMEVEESIRGNPIDGVVLLGGCDKTTPGQVMGAASVDLPTIVVSSGPMLNGKFKGKDIGSGTDVWKFSEAVRGGEMSPAEFFAAESGMSRSRGTCNTMGSASSFAAVCEALGIALKWNATIPAVDANRQAMAHATGRRIVDLVRDGKRLSHFLTREAFENAIRVHAAIGGSTNTVIHLLALAGRVGVELTLDDFDRLGGDMPLLANVKPSGEYLMEDLHYAGGMPALMTELQDRLHTHVETVSGQTIAEQIEGGEIWNSDVIATTENPIKDNSGIWVLRGNLAPDGAIIKPSAASPALLKHRGKAVVFETIEVFKERIDDPELEVDATSVLVLKGCGPKGYPGMPEVGNMPLPAKLLEQGVTDMVRISDARMSGTAFGTVILHASPETSVGGPLGLVRTGDTIELDAEARTLNVLVPEEGLARRSTEIVPAEFDTTRGYVALHRRHVLQAHLGCDLDFLVGKSGDEVKRESH